MPGTYAGMFKNDFCTVGEKTHAHMFRNLLRFYILIKSRTNGKGCLKSLLPLF